MLLPDVDTLRRRMQSLAMLDAILQPEWEYRGYSFNAHWAAHEQMGSWRDGQGGELFVLFNPVGCWIKGYESDADEAVSLAVLHAQVPAVFAHCVAEPAFSTTHTTFCLWRSGTKTEWHFVGSRKWAADLLVLLCGSPADYVAWAEDYFELDNVPLEAVNAVYDHTPLTDALVQVLHPGLSLEVVEEDRIEIGYPGSTDADFQSAG